MPAKTVKDLIELNSRVPSEQKVKVKIYYEMFNKTERLIAEYVGHNGKRIDQTSKARQEYYEAPIDLTKIEKGTEITIPRVVDQNPLNKPTYPYGYVSCKKNSDKEFQCHNAWFVGTSEAAKGYGPLLYDCVLAKLGEKGFGLTADRYMVSTMAGKVWAEYFKNRKDVRKEKLDLNKSTTPVEDDCYASYETMPDWNTWLVQNPEKETDESEEKFEKRKELNKLITVALEYAYFDNGITTLNDLKNAGLLIDGANESYSRLNTTKKLKKLYESFIRDLRG